MIDKEPKVFVFEDDDTWTKLYERLFEQFPQISLTIITSFSAATEFLNGLTVDQDDNTIAIIDGNLSPHEHSGGEGAIIAARLNQLNVFTIGMSGSARGVEGVRYNIGKIMGAHTAVKFAVDKLMLGEK